MKNKWSLFLLIVMFLSIATVKIFAEPPLLSISVNYPGTTMASASHTVTLNDIENLNAGNHIWNVNGNQSGNFFWHYTVRINGTLVHESATPNNNFSFQIQLQVGDVVALNIDYPVGTEGGTYNPSSGSLSITVY